jgi:hypothetical protein
VRALSAALALALAAAGCGPPRDIPKVSAPSPRAALIDAERGWEPPVPMLIWEYIVVHHSATAANGAVSIDREHKRRGWDGLGYHFVIGNGSETPDGAVEVGYRWQRQLTGAHVGGANNIGKIGVCLIGNFEVTRPTAAQMESLHRLLAFLQTRCAIPAGRVRGHSEVTAPGHTLCPGRNLSVPLLREALPAAPPRYEASAVRMRR